MLIECSLDSIKEYLEKESISCKIDKGDGEFPREFLMIDMGKNERGQPQRIELFAINKEIPTENLQKRKDNKTITDKANFLHIQYLMPFEFLDESVNDIARFLLLINKTLDFSGFGMSEVDRMVYFRMELFCDRSKLNTEVLKGFLGYLLLIVDSFSPTIENLAAQKTNLRDVIKQTFNQI